MQDITDRDRVPGTRIHTDVRDERSAPATQALRILHIGFVVLPTIAGLDKFFNMLVNWNVYLAPQFERISPLPAETLMRVVGGIEIAAGLLVALKPKIGAYVVGLWLLAIVTNLVVAGYYDLALRDFALALGAFALGRLATAHDRERATVGYRTTTRTVGT